MNKQFATNMHAYVLFSLLRSSHLLKRATSAETHSSRVTFSVESVTLQIHRQPRVH